MSTVTYEALLEAGVHFGHLAQKWDPKMAPYIFMEQGKIHIIDLVKTQKLLEEACLVAQQLARTGRKILFVGTKKQAQAVIQEAAEGISMPYVTERWLGGMLTNFATVRKSVKKLQHFEKMEIDGTLELLHKKERLMLSRDKGKLDKVLRGIADMNRLPAALFVVDIKKEHIAIAEAKRLDIPTIGIVDTNSNPNLVDFPIPGNDDAVKSIQIITQAITNSIKQGLSERKLEKEIESQKMQDEKPVAEKTERRARIKHEDA